MKRALLFLATLLVWPLPSCLAQDMKASSRLFAREKGDEIQIAIEVTPDPGFHLYHGPGEKDIGSEGAIGKPTTVAFTGEGFEIGALVYPEPRKVPVEIGDLKYTSYEHEGTFVLRARGTRTKPGAKLADLGATISGETCDAKGCTIYEEELSNSGPGADALFAKLPAPAEPAPVRTSGQKASSKLFARAKGEDVEIAIEVTVDPGYHLYHGPTKADVGDPDAGGKPTVVEIDAEGFEIGALIYPAPEKVAVKIGEETLTAYEHHGTFVLRAKGKRTQANAKPEAITASITGYTCDANACTDYAEDLDYAGAGADALYAEPAAQSVRAEDPPSPASSGLWIFLLSAVGWGLFTLLMPCTYPMIPITISYFTKQASQRQGSTLPLSLAYGLGIVGTFVLIGIIVGPPIIKFAAHPVTNLLIGGMFLYFSMTLFGAINLQPPAFLLGVAGKASSHGGLAGVFLMGATLVVTSFTCTAPFVGSLLSAGAATGGLGRVALGMAVFGATMAVPFVALSMVPSKAKAIPRSGEWMHTLKVTLGFVEIAAALKFISNVDIRWEWNWLSRELFLFLWVAIFAAAALYLFGMIRLKDESTTEISPGRMVAGLCFLVFSLYCGYGALGNKLDSIMTAIIPPYSNSLSAVRGGKPRIQETWPIVTDDYEVALAQAKDEQKLLLVNFTGHT